MQELWLLRSARRLMLIDIYMKFREDNLNGFQVIEQKRVRQTDGHIDARGKNNMGRHKRKYSVFEKKCKHQLAQHRNLRF